MRKLVFAVMAAAIMTGTAFAKGEVNVKVGLDVIGNISVDAKREIIFDDINWGSIKDSDSENSKIGFSLGAE
ncbi:MAG: hypothetical protein LBQ47_04860 [Endomicrobium sp.]|jgi:hypothetical protein|nr:hypothetical protein [Endomicrobium sp.]